MSGKGIVRRPSRIRISWSVYMPHRCACYFCGGLVVDAKVTGAICDACIEKKKPR